MNAPAIIGMSEESDITKKEGIQMKKTAAMILACILSLQLGGAVEAEAPEETVPNTEIEVTETAESETAEVPETAEESIEENAFLAWLGEGAELLENALSEGWDKASETVSGGWDSALGAVKSGWSKASEAVTHGMEWLREQMSDWTKQAESYMQEHKWDEKVQECWNTLKEGALHQGKIAQEKLNEAYQTVREWIMTSDETVDQEVAEAVDSVAGAAGVAEAQLSSWYRQMEAYLTEHADSVTEEVTQAWNVIRQNALETGTVAQEELEKARETIREWLTSTGADAESEAVTGLELLDTEE